MYGANPWLTIALSKPGSRAQSWLRRSTITRGAYVHRRIRLTGKVRSGCHHRLRERDGVPEAFELFDEPLGLAFGVALGEVVAAEVAVGLAGGQHVPDCA